MIAAAATERVAQTSPRVAEPPAVDRIEDEVVEDRGQRVGVAAEEPTGHAVTEATRSGGERGRHEAAQRLDVLGSRCRDAAQKREGGVGHARAGEGTREAAQRGGVVVAAPVPAPRELLGREARRADAIARRGAGLREHDADAARVGLEPVRGLELRTRIVQSTGGREERTRLRPRRRRRRRPLRGATQELERLLRASQGDEQIGALLEEFRVIRSVVAMRPQLVEKQPDRRLEGAARRERAGQSGAHPRQRRLLAERLAEAPDGALVAAAPSEGIPHRDQDEGHALELLLREVEVGLRVVEAVELVEEFDSTRPRGLQSSIAGGRRRQRRERLLGPIEPSEERGFREPDLAAAGQQPDGMAHRLERSVESTRRFERHRKIESPVAPIGIVRERAAQRGFRFGESAAPEVLRRAARVCLAVRGAVVVEGVGGFGGHGVRGARRANIQWPIGRQDKATSPLPPSTVGPVHLPIAMLALLVQSAPPAGAPPTPGGGSWWAELWRFAELAVPASPTPPGSAGADAPVNGDASFLDLVLTNPSATEPMRRGAAERLVRMGSAESVRALERALRGTDPRIASAALWAIDRSTVPVPQLAPAILDAALSDLQIDRDAAGRALLASDAKAIEKLGAIAGGQSEPLGRRTGAIRTLAGMTRRDAVRSLIELLAEGRVESADVQRAAMEALGRSTGLKHGDDPAAWRAWWAEAIRAESTGPNDAAMQAVAARIQLAERTAGDERRRADRLAERLVAVYEQLFLSMSQRERLVRAGELLADDLTSVRTFGIGQIERMLRNGERADEATRTAALALLDDPSPALRARGARLLVDLGTADLAKRLAERLPVEREQDVLAAYLAILALQPAPEAFAPVAELVRDVAVGESAARVVVRLVDAGLAPADWQATLLPTVRELVDRRPNGKSVQLLAMGGTDDDLLRVATFLDASDPALRRGAAEGLQRRGVRRPLFERSKDPAIYPPLIVAIAEEPPTLSSVRMLASLPPAPDMRQDWNAAVAKVLRAMPVADLAEADAVLADLPAANPATRLEGLNRCVRGIRAGVPKELIEPTLRSFVDLSVRESRGAEAAEALVALAPARGEPLHDALFRLRVLSGAFAEAARLREDASAWVQLLESVADRPEVAAPIVDEIARRFDGSLIASEQETFDAIRRRLPPPQPTAAVEVRDDGPDGS